METQFAAAYPGHTQAVQDAMPYSSWLAWYAQIDRLRRQRMADMAWAVAVGTRDKPDRAIAKLVHDG